MEVISKQNSGHVLNSDNPLLDEYNMLMDSLHVSVSKHLLREDFLVVWANDRFFKFSGYTREEFEAKFEGRIDKYLDHNEGYLQLTQTVFAAYGSGEPGYEAVINIPRKDGSHLWINLVGRFTDEVIDDIPVVYTVITDVNDLVQVKKETGLTYEALPGFVAKLQLTAAGPRLLYGNDRFLSFFGQDKDNNISSTLLKSNMQKNMHVVYDHLEEFQAGKSVSFETECIGVGNKHALFQVSASCVDWVQDEPIYLVIYIDITEKARQTEELRKLAYVDPVTQGANRACFALNAEKAIQSSPPFSYTLVSLDIQRFKVINDIFGIEAGDKVLGHLYRSIEKELGEEEYLARIASDTFALLLKTCDVELLEKRMALMGKKINLFNDTLKHKYLINLSAGLYCIDDPQLPLINIQDRANMTRKRIKSTTGTQLCSCLFYNNNDRLQLARETEIENRKRDALRNHEFVVYFQPKQDLLTGITAGAEALVRWLDPQHGLIPPMDFIPLFEKNNFIIELDLYVFDQVCQHLSRWMDEGKKPIPISVNMSRAHLSNQDFLSRYEEIRRNHNVPAALLEIEVTETLIFENPELLSKVIDDIRRCGYRCSMDDFGSGYSSLNVLKDIRVDTLKLDRAFLSTAEMGNERERDIINSVIDMAKMLRMETIAEGVETLQQLDFLKQAGCDMIQGFFFSRPIPVEEFEKIAFGSEE